jgi:hypothetical protein
MTDPLQQYLKERNAALTTLDIEWARKHLPLNLSDEVLLVSMHKARYDCTAIEPDLRHASGAWLRERGLSRMMGLPWPPEGTLP